VNLTELYTEVSRRTDTSGTQINAAETSRVCAKLFEVLAGLSTAEATRLIAEAIAKHTS
jgi:hypothetical protein